ncbi:MAG: tol-pal system protein YbgF [Gammaproteobacteria bacterium]|nr:MAG: tol-pal system protein YbgF [Gammaproteobacteria bacterium]
MIARSFKQSAGGFFPRRFLLVRDMKRRSVILIATLAGLSGCATPPPEPAGPTTDQRLNTATRSLHSDIQELREEVKELRNQLEIKSYEIDQMKSRTGASGNSAGERRIPQRFGQLRGSADSSSSDTPDSQYHSVPVESADVSNSRQIPTAQDTASEPRSDDGSSMPGAGGPDANAPASENEPAPDDGAMAPGMSQAGASGGETGMAPEPAPNDGAMAPGMSQAGVSGGAAGMTPEPAPDDGASMNKEPPNADSGAPDPGGSSAVNEQAQAAYDQAFGLLKQSRFDEAHKALQQFVSNFPASSLADNAQYWSGEALYAMRAFDQAVGEFDKVVQNYPESDKAPEALLKKGYSHYELGDLASAEATLNQVVSQYPGSRVSVAAKNRLTQISSDKRRQGTAQ